MSSSSAGDSTDAARSDVAEMTDTTKSSDSLGADDFAPVHGSWYRHIAIRVAVRIAIALLGAVLGVLIGGHTTAEIGPMTVNAQLTFGWGGATVNIPPLGALSVDAYDGPLNLDMTVLQIDQKKATEVVSGGTGLDQLTAEVGSDVRSAIIELLVQSMIWAIVGAAAMSLLVFRRTRDVFISVGTSIALVLGTLAFGYMTFDAKKLQEPRYTGLLTQAPALFGDAEHLADKFADYRKSLVKLVQNVSTLYAAVSTLPSGPVSDNVIRVLHVSDLHLNPAGFDLVKNLTKQFNIDFIVDTGDLVDWGSSPEDQLLNEISRYGVPYVYVRGNHDSSTTQAKVASAPNAIVLDNSETEVDGLTIAGIGDPRFTPDVSTSYAKTQKTLLENMAEKLLSTIKVSGKDPDIVAIHDPEPASVFKEYTPLILSGHKHKRSVTALDKDTLLMVEGSTGGAGLRGLESEKPTPLEADVLYFDKKTKELQAYDEITVGGLGLTQVSIERKVAPVAGKEAQKSAESAASGSAGSSSGGSGGSGGSGESGGPGGSGTPKPSDSQPAPTSPGG